ncbi:hypothetical protein Leryth_011899 [Lithospermum erythrorhizon]|nr:hypothetical protein Leryth_011899 [Lithospermum erythrorhizon]
MGGNRNKSSSGKSFSFFGMFCSKKRWKLQGGEEESDEVVKAHRVWPSDEDSGFWVAEPAVDRKTSAYISYITGKWNNEDSDNGLP